MANSGLVIVSVLGLLALCGPVSAVEDSNLISHWRFDEGAGDIAYDSVSTKYLGLLVDKEIGTQFYPVIKFGCIFIWDSS